MMGRSLGRGTGITSGLLWRNLKIMRRFQNVRRSHHTKASVDPGSAPRLKGVVHARQGAGKTRKVPKQDRRHRVVLDPAETFGGVHLGPVIVGEEAIALQPS